MKKFGLENVKAFKDTGDVEFAPITLFVGQNSCGKSTFVRFPAVLAQSPDLREKPLCLHTSNGNSIDYGNYADVLHNHTGNGFTIKGCFTYGDIYRQCDDGNVNHKVVGICQEKLLTASFDVNFNILLSDSDNTDNVEMKKIEVYYNDIFAFSFEKVSKCRYLFIQKQMINKGELRHVNYEFSVTNTIDKQIRKSFYPPRSALRTIIEQFCPLADDADKEEVFTQAIDVYEMFSSAAPYEDDVYWYNEIDERIKLGGNSKGDGIDASVKEKVFLADKGYHQGIVVADAVLNLINNEFSNVYYIGPFREEPERIYRRESTQVSVGNNGENACNILINDSVNKGDLLKRVSKWFNTTFGCSVEVQELKNGDISSGYYQIGLRDNRNNIVRNIMDVGYGISQILPIVTQIEQTRYINENRDDGDTKLHSKNMFIFEQPELHLHPNAQADLAGLFASMAQEEYYKNNVLLIETHSEHLIRALQLLIADINSPDHIPADRVKVYYVHGDNDKGSWLEEMKMNEYGEFLEEWPSGFFDKAYMLASDMMTAINRRKYCERGMQREDMGLNSRS